MSVLTTLALMVTALVAKVREVDPRDAEIAKLKSEIDDLERKLADVKRDRDGWFAMTMQWRERAHHLAQRPQPAQEQHFIDEAMRQRIQAQMLQHQAYSQQARIQQAQGMQNYQHQQGSLFGVQNQEGLFCNCVPARHDLLIRG
jgi:hypothetical protein